jgi:hypothetical protein
MFKVEAFTNDIVVAARANAELARLALIEQAEKERERVISEQGGRSGILPSFEQIVDGVLGAPLESVSPGGVIVFRWNYLGEVVRGILQTLTARGPRLKGEWLEGLQVFVDGLHYQSENGDFDVGLITGATAEIRIVETVPYARRLEVGFSQDGTTPFVKQVPRKLIEKIAEESKSMYGTIAYIFFNYSDISNPYMLKTSRSHRRRYGVLVDWMQYPSIIIRPRHV